ncbi:MAG: transposase [Paucibacter sp.]|nr:transposase [Roseateles sp.]
MARLPRLAIAGHVHHLVQRGHNGQPFVLDDEDGAHFLASLQESAALHRVAVHAYALTPARLHLLATPPEAQSLSRMMQSLGRRFAAVFNRRHQRSGGLWDGRYRAAPLEAGPHLLQLMRFIDLLPVSLGLNLRAQDYPWSSAAHHLGARRDPLVTDHAGFWAMGNTPFERDQRYARFLEEGVSPQEQQAIEAAVQGSWPLGSAAFKAELAKHTDQPLVPRPRGRPKKIRKTVPN